MLKNHSDLRIDGYYTSLASLKSQNLWDDYQHIFIDFGVNSDAKIKQKVLFVQSLNNQDLVHSNQTAEKLPDQNGHFLFDFSC